jgi:protein gp37
MESALNATAEGTREIEMSGKTGIEWTDVTWNSVRGCSRVSEGCRNCYAERITARFGGISGGPRPDTPYAGFATMSVDGKPQWTGKVALIPEKLAEPLRWRKPRRVFVNSMSDLFHEALPIDHVAAILCVMALAPRHTFQILTKRPGRMLDLMIHLSLSNCAGALSRLEQEHGSRIIPDETKFASLTGIEWPLPNVHLGVSVEDSATADERIPLLLQTPAAVRFVSYEPALGPVNFALYLPKVERGRGGPIRGSGGLDWLIIGGESGPGARPMDLAWLSPAISQCREAGVPVFVKQDSGPRPGKQGRIPDDLWIKKFPK